MSFLLWRPILLLDGADGETGDEAVEEEVVEDGAAPDAGPARSDKVKALVQSSMGFLSGATGETRAALVTRSATVPPLVLAPRNTFVLPGPLTFEWISHRAGRYTVQVVWPAGVVLDRREVVGNRFVYPADAPPLAPGMRYLLRVLAGTHEAQLLMDAGRPSEPPPR
jgi:hypothetical protein